MLSRSIPYFGGKRFIIIYPTDFKKKIRVGLFFFFSW